MNNFAKVETRSVRFYSADRCTSGDIQSGIIARNKLTGIWEPIAKSNWSLDLFRYDMFTFVRSFPTFNEGYADKYADLVEAKNILKADRYDCDNVGKAIGLIKRFLNTHGKA